MFSPSVVSYFGIDAFAIGYPSLQRDTHYFFYLFSAKHFSWLPSTDFLVVFSKLSHDVAFTAIAIILTLCCSSDKHFYRAMLCIRGTIAVGLCPCPCLSVTSRSSAKTAKHRITQTTPHDRTGSLVFWCQRSPRNSTGVTSHEGAECRWSGQNRRLSTNNRLYLENGTR